MPMRINCSAYLLTGLVLESCLEVISQAIHAATTLKPISEIGIPTLLVRKSSKSKTFFPKILKSDIEPKLKVQNNPITAAATVMNHVMSERFAVLLEVRTAATTASNIDMELVMAATTKQK